MSDMIQWRIYSLKSGFATESEKLPNFFYLLAKDEAQKKQNPYKAIISVIGLFIAGLIVFWFVHRLLSAIYKRIERNRSSDLKLKIVRSGLRSMLDLISMCVFNRQISISNENYFMLFWSAQKFKAYYHYPTWPLFWSSWAPDSFFGFFYHRRVQSFGFYPWMILRLFISFDG